MRRKALLSAVVVILAAIVVLAGFWFWKGDNDEKGPQAASRWLVVGLDGADWSAIDRLVGLLACRAGQWSAHFGSGAHGSARQGVAA